MTVANPDWRGALRCRCCLCGFGATVIKAKERLSPTGSGDYVCGNPGYNSLTEPFSAKLQSHFGIEILLANGPSDVAAAPEKAGLLPFHMLGE